MSGSSVCHNRPSRLCLLFFLWAMLLAHAEAQRLSNGCLQSQSEGSGAHAAFDPIIVSIPHDSARPGETIKLPIRVSSAAGIAGAQMKITFDDKILRADRVEAAALTTDFMIADTIMPGKIALGLARATGIPSGNGDLVNLIFTVQPNAQPGDTTTLAWAGLVFYDEATDTIPSVCSNGLFTVVQDSRVDPSDTLRFSVSPNPFTPNNDTFNDRAVFKFSNEIAAQTEVLIFNMAGRRVKSLSAASGKVIEWDGRDDEGRELKPGVYLYLIKQNGNTVKNGTVTLMR